MKNRISISHFTRTCIIVIMMFVICSFIQKTVFTINVKLNNKTVHVTLKNGVKPYSTIVAGDHYKAKTFTTEEIHISELPSGKYFIFSQDSEHQSINKEFIVD